MLLAGILLGPYSLALMDKAILSISPEIRKMALIVILTRAGPGLAVRLSLKYSKLWLAAEVMLFVLVGATVNISYIGKIGFTAVLLIAGALIFRMFGVFLCLIKTKLSFRERLFAMLAYTPKATVQAAIGAIPLSRGLPCADAVLSVAVLSIILTAPIGAFLIDSSYKYCLSKDYILLSSLSNGNIKKHH